jgi:hypothetical protein
MAVLKQHLFRCECERRSIVLSKFETVVFKKIMYFALFAMSILVKYLQAAYIHSIILVLMVNGICEQSVVAQIIASSEIYSDEEQEIQFIDEVQNIYLPLTYYSTKEIPDELYIAKVSFEYTIEYYNEKSFKVALIAPQNKLGVPVDTITPSYPNAPVTIQKDFNKYSSFQQFQSFSGMSIQPQSQDITDDDTLWGIRFTATDVDTRPETAAILKQARLDIEFADVAVLEISNASQSLKVAVDGYGSFGDQSIGNALGARIQHINHTDRQERSTIFYSSIFYHPLNRYLSSFDMYPTERLPNVSLSKIDENLYWSGFHFDSHFVNLFQELKSNDDNSITLKQEYKITPLYPIENTATIEPILLSRLMNPKIPHEGDGNGGDNYMGVRLNSENPYNPELTVFSDIQSATTEDSFYVSTAHYSPAEESMDYWIGQYFVNDYFTNIFLDSSVQLYDQPVSHSLYNDFNLDFVTDITFERDYVTVLGSELRFYQNEYNLIVTTRWGVSSPSAILSVTPAFSPDVNEPIEIPVFETPTPTPLIENTPTPTSTPTPTVTNTPTITPIPTATFTPSDTPTPNIQLRQTIELPDIRVIVGKQADWIFDLDDFFYDPDTEREQIVFSNWTFSEGSEVADHFRIDFETNVVQCHRPFESPGYYGTVTFILHDYTSILKLTSHIRVSSFLTRSFHPAPPIVFSENQRIYNSPYKLNDLIMAATDQAIDLDYVEPIWYVLHDRLPDGIDSIEIRDDTYFSVTANDRLSDLRVQIPFVVRFNFITPTPVVTPSLTPTATATHKPSPMATDTPTFTPTETPSPTATFTDTPTHTYTPTSTSTPTSTATFTSTPTIAPTDTPTLTYTPKATNTPTLTPTPSATTPPSPTATPVCADIFSFTNIQSYQSLIMPVDIQPLPQADENSHLLGIANYLDEHISIYKVTPNRFEIDSLLETTTGAANIGYGDADGDGTIDVFILNENDEELQIYRGDESGLFERSWTVSLESEQIPPFFGTRHGLRYQTMVIGDVDGDNTADAVVRTQSSVIVLSMLENTWQIVQRIDLDGFTRILKGFDVDNDTDLDLIVAVMMSNGEEQVRIYQNRSGTYTWTDSIHTDELIDGNYSVEISINDFDNDSNQDLGILLFTNEIMLVSGRGNGTFAITDSFSPFPAGSVAAFDFFDLDSDGKLDLFALFRNQQGLSALTACGENYQFNQLFEISEDTDSTETYVMQSLDYDFDGDQDIFVTRSIHNDILVIENGIR